MKNISFIPFNKYAKNCFEEPKPASLFIPDWYKQMNTVVRGHEYTGGLIDGKPMSPNTTMKMCSPFLDAMTSGYVWSLPQDILIYMDSNKNILFSWRTENDAISEHTENQHPTLPSAYDGQRFVMKWSFDFIIKTPPGYSTLFTHPINRHDLPFRTFTGVVDTDTYILPVQFPFQLLNSNFPMTIEKGTPVCQIIPFKRDNWKSNVDDISDEEIEKIKFEYLSRIYKAYKSRYWKKKQYK